MSVFMSGTTISLVLDLLLNFSHLDMIIQITAVMKMESQILNIQLTFAVVQKTSIIDVQHFKIIIRR